jgi:hypothetical protein
VFEEDTKKPEVKEAILGLDNNIIILTIVENDRTEKLMQIHYIAKNSNNITLILFRPDIRLYGTSPQFQLLLLTTILVCRVKISWSGLGASNVCQPLLNA